jgi:GAF domain-containing protein
MQWEVEMVVCRQCREVFSTIGGALNEQLDAPSTLQLVAEALTEQFQLCGCQFRLLSRDQRILESVAVHGVSQKFLDKGPVDAERSVVESLKGRTVMITDCTTDPRIQYPQAFAAEGISSLLSVPLKTRGQVIGMMRLYSAETREFGKDEVDLFEVVAMFCASAVIHAMFHQILSHVTEAGRSLLDLPQILDAFVRIVSEDLRAKGCTIQLYDAKNSRLEPRAAYGFSRVFVERLPELVSDSTTTAVLAGECVSILDAASDDRILRLSDVTREKIGSMLLVPLTSPSRPIGLLSLFTHHQYRFSTDEKQLMLAIGDQCSLIICNAQMFAALKSRYDTMVDDFQLWFDHVHVHPRSGSTV